MTKKNAGLRDWQFDSEKSVLIILGASENQLKKACSRPYDILLEKILDAIGTAMLFHKAIWIVQDRGGDLPRRLSELSLPVMKCEPEPFLLLESKDLRKKINKAGFIYLFFAGTRIDVSIIHNALAAKKMGFQPVVIVDACSTDSELAQQTAMVKLTAAGIGVTTSSALSLELY